jgi:prenyltransferase beta subunit
MAHLNTRSVANLRWLRSQGGLDYIERERLVSYIVSLQVRSGEASGKRPPLPNWYTVHGLFYAPGWSPLKDTYSSLAALEILGGLNRIDRDSCIKRILKFHRSKGFFTPPETEDRWRFQIRGDAQDTFCAFESLRILGALDHVKDLEKWQFRVKSNRASKPDANGVPTPTWEEIEAWVCQQRLERIVRERNENPRAPVRSLLDP